MNTSAVAAPAVRVGQIPVREPYAVRATRMPVEVTPGGRIRLGIYELEDRTALLALIADLAIAAQILDR